MNPQSWPGAIVTAELLRHLPPSAAVLDVRDDEARGQPARITLSLERTTAHIFKGARKVASVYLIDTQANGRLARYTVAGPAN